MEGYQPDPEIPTQNTPYITEITDDENTTTALVPTTH
jgi:hypothetical protein